ncbi:hypothetical protein [Polystyrenella longa]|nr:hypothetical protein [Polystyrenella longa]
MFACPAVVNAADEKEEIPVGMVSIEVLPLVNRSRGQSPLPVTLHAFNNSKQILTGDLVIEATEGIESRIKLFTFRTSATFVEGEQRTRMVLPLQLYRANTGQVDLQMYLETNDKRFDLDTHPVQVPNYNSQFFSIGFCKPKLNQFTGEEEQHRLRQVQVEDWLSYKEPIQLNEDQEIFFRSSIQQTVFSELDEDTLPERPIDYTSFDILVMWEKVYQDLSQNEFEAILQWVRAGGNLLLYLPESVDDQHLHNLNTLDSSNSEAPLFYNDIEKQLSWDDASTPSTSPILRHCGLGRVAMLTSELAGDQEQFNQNKLETYLFLWRVRKNIADLLLDKEIFQLPPSPGQLPVDQFNSTSSHRQSGFIPDQFKSEEKIQAQMQLAYRQDQHITSHIPEYWLQQNNAWSTLLPDGFQMVPPSFVMGVMIAYLILVGPGEYWLLGKFKIRKWTWLSFPIITLVFTFFTVGSINAYMQIEDPIRAILVTDVDEQGEVLRQTSFECVLSPSQQIKTTNYDQQLVSPIESTANWMSRPGFGEFNQTRDQKNAAAPLYEGSLSGEYSLTQQLQKWSPQLYVGFSIPKADEINDSTRWKHTPGFWKELTPEILNAPEALRELVARHFPQSVQVEVIRPAGSSSSYSASRSTVQQLMHAVESTRDKSLFLRVHSVAPRPGSFETNQIVADFLYSNETVVRVMWETNELMHVERRVFRSEQPE